jgi:hypothetical protein
MKTHLLPLIDQLSLVKLSGAALFKANNSA